MAVVVQCFHCDTILELDEGFRGGVCRCSTCGSLLQVPKAATTGAPKARPAAPGAVVTENKRPANPNEDPGLSRGQFDPANQKGGSGGRPAAPDLGGSSSGLRGGRPAAPVATVSPRRIEKVEPISGPTRAGPHLKRVKKNNALLYVGIALAAIIVIVVTVVVMMMVMSPPQEVEKGTAGHGHAVAPGANGPAGGIKEGGKGGTGDGGVGDAAPEPKAKGFLGVPLVGPKIVFSIDGASSMSDTFDYVCQGVYRAMDALEPGQQVRVAVWKGNAVKMIPAAGFVGKAGVKELRAELQMLSATGSSEAADCMKASAGMGGDQVIFVTAKYGLEPDIAKGVMAARAGAERFDGVKIEDDNAPSPLEVLAKKTGGSYVVVSTGQLEQMGR